MHYNDLVLCEYHAGPHHAANWRVPLLSVGWLEHPHEFRNGTVSSAFRDKLEGFVPLARTLYSHLHYRGIHFCSICKAEGTASPGPIWSQEIIVVPGDNVIYAAPGGIVHYIESHGYLPPSEFVDAVMCCPAYGSAEYQEALRFSNAGDPPPMVTAVEWGEMFKRQVAEASDRKTPSQ